MKRRWMAGLALLGLFLMVQGVCSAKEEELMTKEELMPLLGNPDVVVIDVRKDGDYKSSPLKIQGSVREEFNDVDNWAGKYPKDKTIVLYCT